LITYGADPVEVMRATRTGLALPVGTEPKESDVGETFTPGVATIATTGENSEVSLLTQSVAVAAMKSCAPPISVVST
jgi:hypothetical protein